MRETMSPSKAEVTLPELPEERDRWRTVFDNVTARYLTMLQAKNPDPDIYGPDDLERLAKKYALKDINTARTGKGRPKLTAAELGSDQTIQEIDAAEGLKILRKTEIHGSPYHDQELTVELIRQQGLAPKYRAQAGSTSIWFSSQLYEIGTGRIAILGYVTSKYGGTVARTFYLSNSQGVWRYLPSYTTDNIGDIDWYDKGYGEDSITLPTTTQTVLAKLSQQPAKKLTIDPNLIFAGTCRSFDPVSPKPITLTLEVEAAPKKMDGTFYPPKRILGQPRRKVEPEKMVFTHAGHKPDFSRQPTKKYNQESSLYGIINIETFPSRDNSLSYLFCRDRLNRVWIGGVDMTTCQTRTTGLREFWVQGGDLTTPAYEYDDQTGGYGDTSIRNGHYVDVYKNYLSKIPVIQEYLQSLKTRGLIK